MDRIVEATSCRSSVGYCSVSSQASSAARSSTAKVRAFCLDIVLGIVGAIVGGFLFSIFGAEGVSGFNIYSLIVAIIGSVVVLWLYHAVVGRRSV